MQTSESKSYFEVVGQHSPIKNCCKNILFWIYHQNELDWVRKFILHVCQREFGNVFGVMNFHN